MPDGPALVTLDLGTTRLKVAAFEVDGTLIAQFAERNTEHREGDRAWQEPAEWWANACTLLRRLVASPQLAAREIVGLSLSGRGGGAVFVDERGAPLSPSWSDRRHAPQLAALVDWRRDGGQLANYAMALLAKLQWLREHDPEAASRLRHAMYAKDWLLYRLTGECVTDPTSGPDRADWDAAALDHAGVDRSIVPTVMAPWEIAGAVTDEAAEACGVPAGTPVAVGGHDGICANLGAGAGEIGAYAITVGTHAVVRAVTAEAPQGAYRFYGIPPDRHVIGGNAVMAGRAADWFLDGWLDHPTEQQRPETFARIDREAAAVERGAGGVRFLPFLAGQVAPDARPGAAAAFAGLRLSHGRPEMYRAILEGGAFAIRAIFEQVRGWCGDPTVVRFTGGGATSALWRRIIVDVLRWPVEATGEAVEGRGAAIYLAVALGYHPDVDAAAGTMVRVVERLTPDAAAADEYDAIYEHWRTVSDALRPLDEA